MDVEPEETSWVALTSRFSSGWPWPEESWGLDPMYGPDGWCRDCGTPLREQVGPLTIQGRGFPTAAVWVPNWTFDAVCVSAGVAEGLADFAVELRDVHKPRSGPTGVKQLVARRRATNWYSPSALDQAVVARHHRYHGDQTGATCSGCGRWRWLPVSEGDLAADLGVLPDDSDLVSANPRVWSIVELPQPVGPSNQPSNNER